MSNYYPPPQGQAPQMHQGGPYAQQQQSQYQPQGQSQEYYQQQSQYPPPSNGQPQAYGGDSKFALAPEGFEGEKFVPTKPKFHDPIFALLFLAVLLGFTAVSVISLRAFSISNVSGGIGGGQGTGLGSTLNTSTAVLLMLSCAVALVFSIIYLLLVRTFTTVILEVTLALSVLLNIAYAVYLWVEGFTSAAIIFTIFAVLSIVSYFFMRKRIPLAKVLLQTIIRAANEYKSVYVVALLALVVQTAFSAWTAWTLVAVYQRFEPNTNASGSSSSSGAVIGLVVFVIFAFYFISEVIKNIAFTTVCGVFGTWFYGNPASKPAHAALSAFKRSITYSLGSICFGSLIVALLDLLRALLTMIQSQEASEGDLVGSILACVAGCCVGCLASLASFFNRYAYINIALYGNSYLTAARETWTLLKHKGIDALINDSLVNIVWTIGSFIVGTLCALFAYIYLKQTNPSYVQESSGYFSVILLYAFGLGINICMALGSGSIGSGVSTFFVALAEDPHVVAQRDPQLFETIRRAYPDVINAVG